MISLVELWLPVLLSGVAVFICGFLSWLVFPHHKKDWVSLENEDAFFGAIKDLGIKPGEYMFPWCHGIEKEVAHQRYGAGPWGTFYLQDKQPKFVRNLLLTLAFDLFVGVLVAYVASMTLDVGTDSMKVFRVVSVCAFMAHCMGLFPHYVFTSRRMPAIFAAFLDGLVYALVTGGIFAWLWPAGEAVLSV